MSLMMHNTGKRFYRKSLGLMAAVLLVSSFAVGCVSLRWPDEGANEYYIFVNGRFETKKEAASYIGGIRYRGRIKCDYIYNKEEEQYIIRIGPYFGRRMAMNDSLKIRSKEEQEWQELAMRIERTYARPDEGTGFFRFLTF